MNESTGILYLLPPQISEAGIKSFKFHLLRCLKSQIFTFEELSTLTTQIEACLNSRPICPLSSDSDDFNPLTPGHFLIGRPLTALPESNDDDVPINYLDRRSLNKKIKNVFWKRWNREYLNNLQQRLKRQKETKVASPVKTRRHLLTGKATIPLKKRNRKSLKRRDVNKTMVECNSLIYFQTKTSNGQIIFKNNHSTEEEKQKVTETSGRK
ncbi:hypothetical protein LAZ67_8001667 [Cordylochernes scorpioides]|uniref:DUF5641 domain-containing protein n=1 Tax=Cordylochernes scorpioides TaxID=51811 RepID=A0ABY6KT79_9ARAC|nr:hypothetical protein LAZ67_8001667 [Cordylochernes scorpioides]